MLYGLFCWVWCVFVCFDACFGFIGVCYVCFIDSRLLDKLCWVGGLFCILRVDYYVYVIL